MNLVAFLCVFGIHILSNWRGHLKYDRIVQKCFTFFQIITVNLVAFVCVPGKSFASLFRGRVWWRPARGNPALVAKASNKLAVGQNRMYFFLVWRCCLEAFGINARLGKQWSRTSEIENKSPVETARLSISSKDCWSGYLDIKDAQNAETKDVLEISSHVISCLGAMGVQKGSFERPKS